MFTVRAIIEAMAGRLAGVPGVVGVVLGGSRARGEHTPGSDYYRSGLDLDALRALAGPGVEVAGPGGWGPWVDGAAKGAACGDTLYVALCLAHAVGVLVQALYAADRRWCLNEKGALAVAETLPTAPPGFGPRARALLAAPGGDPAALTATVAAARGLVEDTEAALREAR
ncbi:hypothetical protein [Kitasatospora purpeofusca]|uniref:hypothetical protein n=1 Tax=Kitasatospora purpeofusca TaxID=67352 RepID=UPI00224D3E10|nr:hypothetical protein [Kitasatospora purpeofusca]MCX4753938.1 hypothetical protein [Kitasatospora purpeofusca]WSR33402.1 hypothetical protein OG715_21850 [Kitasatospora purpeofusca]